MFPSVRTVRPEKPSGAAGFSYWRKEGEKTSPETCGRSKPPVAVTDTWCFARLIADQVPVTLPVCRKVLSSTFRYWKVSNGLETSRPPPLNGFRTYRPLEVTESRFMTPGVYPKQ